MCCCLYISSFKPPNPFDVSVPRPFREVTKSYGPGVPAFFPFDVRLGVLIINNYRTPMWHIMHIPGPFLICLFLGRRRSSARPPLGIIYSIMTRDRSTLSPNFAFAKAHTGHCGTDCLPFESTCDVVLLILQTICDYISRDPSRILPHITSCPPLLLSLLRVNGRTSTSCHLLGI